MVAASTCLQSARPQVLACLTPSQKLGQNSPVSFRLKPASGLTGLTLRSLAGPARKQQAHRLSISASISSPVAASEGVQYVDAEQAKQLVEDGYTILDVRDNSQYNRSFIPSCVHVPMYVDNNDMDPGALLNRALHNGFAGFLFGIPYLKQNPDFVSEVQAKVGGKDAKLVVVCQQGMRSGTAVRMLESSGFEDIAYLALGLDSVPPGVFPKEGARELKDAGKAGLYSVQGPLTIALFFALATVYLFIQFFPTQAFDWFGLTA
eukprot:TRINITY_DN8_c0_g1_i1.p1 TRINITY_DN8_c0_g1~~TRINITY_DN8_c0_g1_i1.p1  ORF type:complete len:263 (+),score=50.12 TRINITY_DN8_c0_g1_i1:64-852(+)